MNRRSWDTVWSEVLRSVGRLFRVRLEQRLGCLPRSSCSVIKPSDIFVVLAWLPAETARWSSTGLYTAILFIVERRSRNRTECRREVMEGTGGEERGRGPLTRAYAQLQEGLNYYELMMAPAVSGALDYMWLPRVRR